MKTQIVRHRFIIGMTVAIIVEFATSAKAQPFPDISSWPTSFQTAAFIGIAIGFIVITVLGRRAKFSATATAEEDPEVRELRLQLREARFRDEIIIRFDQIIDKLNLDDRFSKLEHDADHAYAELDKRLRDLENEAAIRWRRHKPEA